MTKVAVRKGGAVARRPARHNTIAFPRELREAIPDLHGGRVLELDSITGRGGETVFGTRIVELKLLVKETGKLRGEFVLHVGLQVEAARELSATLARLANEAEK
jgi:hypothetical protein